MRWAALILLMLPLCGSAAEPLGRLFYTPEQRATLDNARRQKIQINVEPEAPATPENISVNGVIKRSDGESTIWINNQPVSQKHTANGIKIIGRSADNASVTLRLPQSTRNVDVKVGQNLDATNGHIQESYQIPPPPPVVRKKTAPSAQNEQQKVLANPPRSPEKPDPGISSQEANGSEPSPQPDEQSTNPSTQKPLQNQY